MRSYSTFGAFTTARLGIYAAQKGLDVTGHNITNINTQGYTRQRLDQMSLRVGGKDRYQSVYDTYVGSGVLTTGVSQLRDPYLDIRYRDESASVGAADAKLAGLEDLAKLLDEVYDGTDHDGIIEAQFNDLVKMVQNLSSNVGSQSADSLVRTSAEALVKLFNDYAEKLEGLQKAHSGELQGDVGTVNSLLVRIRDLNDSIQKSEIHGDAALELKDQRNLYIDELSKYVKIKVEYQAVSIGAGSTVDKLVIRTAENDGSPQYTLVDGSYAGEVAVVRRPKANPAFAGDPALPPYLKPDGTPTGDADEAEQVDYYLDFGALKDAKDRVLSSVKLGSTAYATEADAQAAAGALPTGAQRDGTVLSHAVIKATARDGTETYYIQTTSTSGTAHVGDTDLLGSLQASRELLTEAGEYATESALSEDKRATTKRGIPYYQKSLDSLAQKFAQVLNGANNGYLMDSKGNYLDRSGAPITYTDAGGDTVNLTRETELTDALRTQLEAEGVKLGGNLISNSSKGNDATGVTAANISISKDWSVGNVRIVNSFEAGTGKDPNLDTDGDGVPDVVGPNSTATDNILHLRALLDGDQAYTAGSVVWDAVDGDEPFLTGSFQELLGHVTGTLANDQRITTTLLQNYVTAADETANSRDGISGVDLNDEATSLMQYQKSYAAACRLMTTLDEALDKLINGTGVVGR